MYEIDLNDAFDWNTTAFDANYQEIFVTQTILNFSSTDIYSYVHE